MRPPWRLCECWCSVLVMSQIVVAALYRFVPLDDFSELKQPIQEEMQAANVRGTLLLAREGINGTVAGDRAGIDRLLAFLRRDPRLEAMDVKESFCEVVPFVCAFVKRACLDDVGLLDEDFFAYFEDSDFCLRAGERGWEVASLGDTSVVHLGPGLTSRRLGGTGELYRRSHVIFERKWGRKLDDRFPVEAVFVGGMDRSTGYGFWSRHAQRAALDAGVLTHYQSARYSPGIFALSC